MIGLHSALVTVMSDESFNHLFSSAGAPLARGKRKTPAGVTTVEKARSLKGSGGPASPKPSAYGVADEDPSHGADVSGSSRAAADAAPVPSGSRLVTVDTNTGAVDKDMLAAQNAACSRQQQAREQAAGGQNVPDAFDAAYNEVSSQFVGASARVEGKGPERRAIQDDDFDF